MYICNCLNRRMSFFHSDVINSCKLLILAVFYPEPYMQKGIPGNALWRRIKMMLNWQHIILRKQRKSYNIYIKETRLKQRGCPVFQIKLWKSIPGNCKLKRKQQASWFWYLSWIEAKKCRDKSKHFIMLKPVFNKKRCESLIYVHPITQQWLTWKWTIRHTGKTGKI